MTQSSAIGLIQEITFDVIVSIVAIGTIEQLAYQHKGVRGMYAKPLTVPQSFVPLRKSLP
jgi:hypothetical protein